MVLVGFSQSLEGRFCWFSCAEDWGGQGGDGYTDTPNNISTRAVLILLGIYSTFAMADHLI